MLKKSFDLLDQILECNKQEDFTYQQNNPLTLGSESFNVFFLEQLKLLMLMEILEIENKSKINEQQK